MIEKFLETDKNNRVSIAVIGDLMIDQYHTMQTGRISPEFPIPILRSDTEIPQIIVPGGTANCVAQFKHFNVYVSLFGIIDSCSLPFLSQYFPKSVNIWENRAIGSCCLSDNYKCHIPIKKRYYSHDGFPLCRLDIEETNYGLTKDEITIYRETLKSRYKNHVCDVAIFSDYNKGLFDDTNWVSLRSDVITIVDPKKGPISKWQGCTVFKPNSTEARELSGLNDPKEQCDYFCRELGCRASIITLGGSGVVAKIDGEYFEYHPKKKTVAESVIGAGDTFVAFLAMAIARKMSIQDAIELAFEAGAIYVQKKHNQPISQYELLKHFDPIQAKFVEPSFLKNRDYTLCWINGCFDIIGVHHVDILNYAKSLGDKLVVGIDCDEAIKKHKGPTRPVNPLEYRMQVLAALECVDFIIPYSNFDATDIIREIRPETMVKGIDWQGKKVCGSEYAGRMEFYPFKYDISTTKIIEKMEK